MAGKATLAAESAQIMKSEFSAYIRSYCRQVEIDQMAVIIGIPLKTADAVRIMADRTGGVLLYDMSPMMFKAFIA